MIDPEHPQLSVRRQCALIGLNRSTLYHQPVGESALNLTLMKLIDQEYTRAPFYGYRRMTARLREEHEHEVNHKRVARLMGLVGLQAVYPKPNTSVSQPHHPKFPYLLRGMAVTRPNQVWASDITYIPLRHGFMYLVAVMDWCSRYVLSWRLSNTLDGTFCQEALADALKLGQPDIVNTDQGAQFTAKGFTGMVQGAGIQVSMDGRGRAFDNIFIERLWRSVKYEDVYIKGYETAQALRVGLGDYFQLYNHARPHQSLGYKTPASVYQLADGPLLTPAKGPYIH